MPACIAVALLDQIVPGKGAAVTIGSNAVALFKVRGVVYAIEAWCLRCGACLAEGSLEGGSVACPGCDWRYEVTTGSVVGMGSLRLNTFDVEVVAGQIIVANA